MKVKVVNKDKSEVVEIPAEKVLVISDKKIFEVSPQEFTPAQFLTDEESIPEIEVDSYGAACFFYNPVYILDMQKTEEGREAGKMIFVTGTFMWVAVGNQFVEENKHTEKAYSKEVGESTIVTTPRGYMQLVTLTDKEKEDADCGNFRIEVDLGNFCQRRGGRFADEVLAQVWEFVNVPRDPSKDYSDHTPKNWNSMFMIGALQDPMFEDHANSILPGYWHNVALIGM